MIINPNEITDKELQDLLRKFKPGVQVIKAETDFSRGGRAQILSMRNYRNKYGEISRQVINGGIPHRPVISTDLERYKRAEKTFFSYMVDKFGNTLAYESLAELKRGIETSLSGTNTRSTAQIESFIPINNIMKVGVTTGKLYCHGYLISKVVIVAGVYPEVKHQKKTLAKNEWKRVAGIKGDNYRMFIIEPGRIDTVRLGGRTVDLLLAA